MLVRRKTVVHRRRAPACDASCLLPPFLADATCISCFIHPAQCRGRIIAKRLRACLLSYIPCKMVVRLSQTLQPTYPHPLSTFLKLFLSVAPSIIRFHKDQGSQKTVRDNGETKSWRGSFYVGSGTHELRLSALLHPEETKAWSEKKRCEHTHTCSSL